MGIGTLYEDEDDILSRAFWGSWDFFKDKASWIEQEIVEFCL